VSEVQFHSRRLGVGWSVLLLSRSQTLFYHETTASSLSVGVNVVVMSSSSLTNSTHPPRCYPATHRLSITPGRFTSVKSRKTLA